MQDTLSAAPEAREIVAAPLPNFLGIGAQKSGTTWLHNMLAQHPQICLPRRKELMFFDIKANYDRGVEPYRQNFRRHTTEPAIGEITPGYLWTCRAGEDYQFNAFRAGTPARVRAMLGNDVRLIVLLRDPVWRAVSAFVHHISRGRIQPGDSILDAGRRYGIISMGFYYRQLESWFAEFDSTNFLVCSYEQAAADKATYIKKVCQFLDVTSGFEPKRSEKRYMKNHEYERADDGVYLAVAADRPPVKIIDTKELEGLRDIFRRDGNLLKKELGIEFT